MSQALGNELEGCNVANTGAIMDTVTCCKQATEPEKKEHQKPLAITINHATNDGTTNNLTVSSG